MPSLGPGFLKIPDLATLKESLPGSVLVALDTEGGRCKISEIGLAILRTKGRTSEFDPSLSQFYQQNGVKAFTIELRKRGFEIPESRRYGSVELASAEEVGSRVNDILSSYDGNRILVGFDLRVEFEWMSKTCPWLASSFDAWVDLQELVSQRILETSLEPGELWSRRALRPSLTDTLNAMQIEDRGWHAHHAANDAVRFLTLLSGLISDMPLAINRWTELTNVWKFEVHRSKVQGSNAMPARSFLFLPEPPGKHLFTARITTADGRKLPPQTPLSLFNHFARYIGLKAVGFNWQAEASGPSGVKFWWVSFQTQELLTKCTSEIHGSTLGGTKLSVVESSELHAQKAEEQQGSTSPASQANDRKRLKQNWWAVVETLYETLEPVSELRSLQGIGGLLMVKNGPAAESAEERIRREFRIEVEIRARLCQGRGANNAVKHM